MRVWFSVSQRRILVIGRGSLGSALISAASLPVDSVDLPEIDLAVRGQARDFLRRVEPDWVLHTAAIADVDFCEQHPNDAWAVNAEGTREVAEVCAALGARLLYTSSDSVFGKGEGPHSESDRPHPVNVYAETKLAGEDAVREVPGSIIVRLPWLVGGERPDFVSFCIDRLRSGEEVVAFTDYIGYILTYEDAARVIWALLADEGATGIFHLHRPPFLSRYEQAQAVARELGKPELVRAGRVVDKPARVPRPTKMNLANSHGDHPAMRLLPSMEDTVRKLVRRAG